MTEAEKEIEVDYMEEIMEQDRPIARFFMELIEHEAMGSIPEEQMYKIIREIRLTEDCYDRCN
jgi:hypothetical protein